ncbi:MAG TPA: cupin domain-containing protein [Gaiellales bacterium]|nr:cupin domain-containing protein [Gaiellales bacterium]
MKEAGFEDTGAGLAPAGEGWFVVNVRDTAWLRSDHFGGAAIFESDAAADWDIGYTIGVIPPGRPSGMYHSEGDQEDFLVLRGECLLLIDGVERRLRAWDFVHCPPGTEHIFVGAGDEPCIIFMTGARRDRGIRYPRSELALRHGAGVEAETTSPNEAYARFPRWGPGRPESWASLPWAGER